MNELKIPFDGGLVTSRDPSDLQPGELVQASGVYYKPGDPNRIHILPTRGVFNSSAIGSGAIKGLGICQFDAGGTDLLVALFGTAYYYATPGATGSFSSAWPVDASAGTGLTSTSTRLSVCHMDDRWYLANGKDRPRVVERAGTIRLAGMKSPIVPPVVTALTVAGVDYYPDDPGNIQWSRTANAMDRTGTPVGTTDAYAASSFAYANLAVAGSLVETWDWTSADTGKDGTLLVVWTVSGARPPHGEIRFGVKGTTTGDFNVTAKLEYSVNGTTYATLSNLTLTTALPESLTTQVALTGVTVTNLKLRATLTYNSGSRPATFCIYNIKFSTAPTRTAFTPTTGYYYSFTEYDQATKLESAPSASSNLVAGNVSILGLSLALPGTNGMQNTNTTHFNVYRTYDGGTTPSTLGGPESVPVTSGALTTYVDRFEKWGATDVPLPLLRMLSISSNREGEILTPIDIEPPAMRTLTEFQGSLVGTPTTDVRTIRYSEAGYPESWPEFNIISKFPIPERDEIVSCISVGDTLMIACTNAIVTMTSLPRVLDGVFNASEAVPIKGQPGCVGQYAITAYSVAGEPRVVWVSPYGIHETNGVNSRRLTNSIDWSATVNAATLSTAVLHWNPKTLTIKFAYDSDGGGTNDRFLLLHMAPEHQTDNGPKFTGPFTASINCLASAEVAGVYRQYSGNPTDGKVYLEESTGAEAVAVETSRIYGSGKSFRVSKGNLRHSAIAGETCSIAYSSGDDANSEEQIITNTVALDNEQGTEFWVNRQGEWLSLLLTYSGATAGSFLDVRVQVSATGKPGRIAT